MKHVKKISVAKALVDHPNIVDSIMAFLEDPAAVLDLHKKDQDPEVTA